MTIFSVRAVALVGILGDVLSTGTLLLGLDWTVAWVLLAITRSMEYGVRLLGCDLLRKTIIATQQIRNLPAKL